METEHDWNFWHNRLESGKLHDPDSYEELDRKLHLDTQHELFFGFLLMIAIVAGAGYALYLVLN